jgi:hypothetical protein
VEDGTPHENVHLWPKQSSHFWYGTFENLVIMRGLEASPVNGGLFMLHDKNQDIAVPAVILNIDDLLIIATEDLIEQIMDQTMRRFWMDDLGSVNFYLGMNIERNGEHHPIDITSAPVSSDNLGKVQNGRVQACCHVNGN